LEQLAASGGAEGNRTPDPSSRHWFSKANSTDDNAIPQLSLAMPRRSFSILPVHSTEAGFIPRFPDSLAISRIHDDTCILLMFMPFLPDNDLPFVIKSAGSSSSSFQGNVV